MSHLFSSSSALPSSFSSSSRMQYSPVSHFAAPTVPRDMLTNACKTQDLDIVRLAIQKGAQPDRQTLTFACMTGNVNIIDAVVARGAAPDEETLNVACAINQLVIVQKVINLGAQRNANTLDLASKTRNPAIIGLISRLPSPPPSMHPSFNKPIPRAPQPVSPPIPPKPQIPAIPSDRLTLACKSQNPDCVFTAIDQGALPNAETLDVACAAGEHALKIVRAVLKVGARPRETTLSIACRSGNLEIIQAVFAAGAKPSNDTLTCACTTGEDKIIKFVLDVVNAKPDKDTLNTILNRLYHKFSNYQAGLKTALRWVVEKGALPASDTLTQACNFGDTTDIDYIKSLGAKHDANTLYSLVQRFLYSTEWVCPFVEELLAKGAIVDTRVLTAVCAGEDGKCVNAVMEILLKAKPKIDPTNKILDVLFDWLRYRVERKKYKNLSEDVVITLPTLQRLIALGAKSEGNENTFVWAAKLAGARYDAEYFRLVVKAGAKPPSGDMSDYIFIQSYRYSYSQNGKKHSYGDLVTEIFSIALYAGAKPTQKDLYEIKRAHAWGLKKLIKGREKDIIRLN